jgi:hypothetical protein
MLQLACAGTTATSNNLFVPALTLGPPCLLCTHRVQVVRQAGLPPRSST